MQNEPVNDRWQELMAPYFEASDGEVTRRPTSRCGRSTRCSTCRETTGRGAEAPSVHMTMTFGDTHDD